MAQRSPGNHQPALVGRNGANSIRLQDKAWEM